VAGKAGHDRPFASLTRVWLRLFIGPAVLLFAALCIPGAHASGIHSYGDGGATAAQIAHGYASGHPVKFDPFPKQGRLAKGATSCVPVSAFTTGSEHEAPDHPVACDTAIVLRSGASWLALPQLIGLLLLGLALASGWFGGRGLMIFGGWPLLPRYQRTRRPLGDRALVLTLGCVSRT